MLPAGHAEPGPFRSRRTPYMVPLQRACHGPWKGIVGVMGSQMGKTDSMANMFGAKLDDDPAPLIYLGPTRNFVERTWEPRFMDMIESTHHLKNKITRGKTLSKTQKTIAGVKVSFAWAGSAAAVAGEPAAYVFVDERDRMGGDVEGEGDPVALANARHSTYPDGKTIVFSTPLHGTVDVYIHPDTGLEHWKVADSEEVQSPTWRLWQRGTRHEWMVPCKHCHEYFAPRFRHLWWPDSSEPGDLDEKNVLLTCPHCGAQMSEDDKGAMNEAGQAVAPGQWVTDGEVHGDPPTSDWYTFWASGLMSPWRSWANNAREYVAAAHEGDSETIQTITNTRFGELYSISGEAPPWEDVAALRLDYAQGTIPEGVATLLLTVDVQKERLVYVVRGWSRSKNMESWLIECGEIFGDTSGQQVWDELAVFRTRTWGEHDQFTIKRCFVDQKYRTQYVFDFCNTHRMWAYPVAGRLPQTNTPEAQRPLSASAIEVNERGKTIKAQGQGLQRWTLNTDYFKRWIHDRVAVGNDGGFHISADTSDDYCKQMVSEARIVKPNGRVMWLLISRDNHYLDCEMMQVGCAYSLRLQHYSGSGGTEAPKRPQDVIQQVARRPGWVNKRGGWMR